VYAVIRLIWEDAGLFDRGGVAKTRRNDLDQLFVSEDTMTLKRIQVHSRHLPRRVASDLAPLGCAERKCRQHLKRNVRDDLRLAGLELLEFTNDRRKILEPNRATDKVTKKSFLYRVLKDEGQESEIHPLSLILFPSIWSIG